MEKGSLADNLEPQRQWPQPPELPPSLPGSGWKGSPAASSAAQTPAEEGDICGGAGYNHLQPAFHI